MNGLDNNTQSESVKNGRTSLKQSGNGMESRLEMMMNMFMMQMMNNMSNAVGHHGHHNTSNIPPAIPAIPAIPAVPSLPGLATEPAAVATDTYGPTHGSSTNTSNSRYTPMGDKDFKCKLPKL
mmetsp:Transcript_14764/g.13240  ORF Transcript_14764/g.13240 Transcript_14764/m.13240 type:complete len:123 (-) Transcript_14764:25-393(-)